MSDHPLRSKSGVPLTPEIIAELAAEAEAGYELTVARRVAETAENEAAALRARVAELDGVADALSARIAVLQGQVNVRAMEAQGFRAKIAELTALLADTQSDLEAEVADDYRIGDELSRLNEYKARNAELGRLLDRAVLLMVELNLGVVGRGAIDAFAIEVARALTPENDAALAEPSGE